MRTCRVIAILTLVSVGACGFDTSGLGSPSIADASRTDDVDAPSASNDASVAVTIDASPPDASPPDASPPDAAPPPCGHLGQACCAPDNSCGLGICLNDVCVSLSR